MSDNKGCEVTSPLIEGEWIGYWEHPIAGEKELELPEQYTVLVVLKGETTLTFKKQGDKTISEKSLVLIDQQQIDSFRWEANTTILIYTPPAKIFRFFDSCSSAFNMSCFTIVPINRL